MIRLSILAASFAIANAMSASSQAPPVPVRDVEISSFDGHRLAATYYDPGVPGPGVLIFRNCDQRRTGVDGFARKLSARGVHVISYDYRDGSAPNRSWREGRTDDAASVHTWLLAQRGIDSARFAAVGGSCGVQVALDFAMTRSRGLQGIVILSGPSDSSNRSFIARSPGIGVLGGTSKAEGGEANGFIPPVVSASAHRASRMIVVPNGHGTDILKVDAEFEATVIAWLAERLAPHPVKRDPGSF